VIKFIKVLARVARSDAYLRPLVNTAPTHCDGLGYVIYSPLGLKFMKYDAIDYPEPTYSICESNLEVLDSVVSRLGMELRRVANLGTYAYSIIHVRRASKGEPRGSLHAHPYLITDLSSEGPTYYFLVHNGGVDKYGLINSLGIDVDPNSVTDSNLLAEVLLRGGGEDLSEFRRRFSELIRYVKSALITATLVIKPGKAYIIVTSYIKEGMSNLRVRYYRTYLVRGSDYVVVTSSTVHDLAKDLVTNVLETRELRGVELISDGEVRNVLP